MTKTRSSMTKAGSPMTKARLSRAGARQQSGFTLIEVVGAVAIVGIWFLLLSVSAFRGIAAEGTAQRRLEASLVADEVLAEAETQALLDLPIDVDTAAFGDVDFDGVPEFEIVVGVEPFDPSGRFRALGPTGGEGPPGQPDPDSDADAELVPVTMQRVRIEVFPASDFNGFDDLGEAGPPLAERTTFVLDTSALTELDDLLDPSPGAGAGDQPGPATGAAGGER